PPSQNPPSRSAPPQTPPAPPAPAAPAAPARGPAAVPAAAAAEAETAATTAEARRVEVLRAMLDKKGLLLPPPFSEAKFEPAGSPAQVKASFSVNLAGFKENFNVIKEGQTLSTTDALVQRLNGYLETNPNSRIAGTKIQIGRASCRERG